MNQNLRFALKFDAETGQFVANVRAGDQALDRFGVQSVQTGKQVDTLSRQSDVLSDQFSSLRNQVLAVAGGFSLLAAAGDATRTLGQYQDMRTQITALVGGQREWIETEQYLIATASEHNKVLTSMAGNYARLASLQEAGLLSVDEMRQIFEGMSNAQSQTGADTVQLEQSMYGLSQALASPIVRAEELNQVVEPLPGLLNKLDKAAGLQSGGFRQMMLDGEVTSDFFKDTLIKALDDYDGAAERTANNINARFASLTNSYQQAVVAFESPISDSLTPMLDTASASLVLVADNADTVSNVVELSLVLALARGAAGLTNLSAARVKDTLATRTQLKATVDSTTATIAATSAEIARLEALQVSNAFVFRSTGGEKALAVARGQLTAATQTLTGAQLRLNAVSRAGAASMALLGGPVGVAMLAAGALAFYATKASDARVKTKDLDDEVASLAGSFDNLNRQERAILITQLNQEMSETRTAIVQTTQQIDGLKASMSSLDAGGRVDARSRIQELEDQITTYKNALTEASAKQQAVFNAGLPTFKQTPESEDEDSSSEEALSAGDKRLAQLQQQTALLGKTGELARINYEIESGAIADLTPALAEKLRMTAEELDKRREALEQGKEANAQRENAEEELDRLRRSVALHGETGEAARVRWEIEHGALRNVNEELQRNILLEAEKLDALATQEETTQGFWERYTESMRASAENTDALWASTFDNFTSGFGRAFADAITQTTSLEDAVVNMAAAMGKSMLQAIGEIIAQKMVLWALEKTIFASEQAGNVAQVTAEGTSAAMLAGIHAYKSAAAIPYYGFMMAPGAQAAALAATMPMAASAAAAAAAGFAGMAHDGIGRVPKANEGTWLLKANEMVLNESQADNFHWMVGMMQQMQANQSSSQQAAPASGQRQPIYFDLIQQSGDAMTITRVEQQEDSEGQRLKVYIAAAKKAVQEDLLNGGEISAAGESKFGWQRIGQ